MGRTNPPARRDDLERIATTRREIKELTDAWNRRHLIARDTPEYAAALETEERLVTRMWRRLRPEGRPTTRRPAAD